LATFVISFTASLPNIAAILTGFVVLFEMPSIFLNIVFRHPLPFEGMLTLLLGIFGLT
jgi:hypothetical protein